MESENAKLVQQNLLNAAVLRGETVEAYKMFHKFEQLLLDMNQRLKTLTDRVESMESKKPAELI